MHIVPIARIHRPSPAEFVAAYLETETPVVLTGVMDDWRARTRWTLDFFRAHFGAIQAPVRGSDREADVFFGNVEARRVQLNEYFDLIERPQPGRRPPYLGNLSFNDPVARPLLAPLLPDFAFPPYLASLPEHETRLWIGAAGQTSTIHNDSYHNLNAQVLGRKSFLLFAPPEYQHLYTECQNPTCWVSRVDPDAPDLKTYPLTAHAQGVSASLEPGEILFIPKFWWHAVRAETVAVNLNMWAFTPGEALWTQPALATAAG